MDRLQRAAGMLPLVGILAAAVLVGAEWDRQDMGNYRYERVVG